MRMPESGEDLVGKVCACSIGRAAVVTGRKLLEFGECWVGLGFDGKGTWASKQPVVLAESADEFRERLDTRFGGKLSFNS